MAENCENISPKLSNHSCVQQLKLKSIILRYFRTSSIRGFPKIVTSDKLHLRVSWSLAIFCLLCISGFTVVKVIHNYLDQNVVLKFRTLTGNEDLFPAVSICDTLPFAPHVIDEITRGRISGVLSPKQYREWLYQNIDFEKMSIPVSQFANLITYFEHIGSDHQQLLRTKHNGTIKACFYSVEGHEGIEIRDTKCNVEATYLSPFFNCYRIQPRGSLRKHERYLRLQFYIEKKPTNFIDCHHCILEAKETLYDGVFFNMQNPLPVLDTNTATVFQTGTHVKLLITPEKYVKSPRNHKCRDNSVETMTYYDFDSAKTIPYNSRLCWYFQLTKRLLNQCNCMMESFPSYIPVENRKNYSRCLNFMMYNLTSGKHYLGSLHYLSCLKRIGIDKYFFTEDGFPKSPPQSSEECLPECSFLKYKKELYQNPIISKYSYLDIYRDSLKPESFYFKLVARNEDYDRAVALTQQNKTKEATEIIENSPHQPLQNFIFMQIERNREPDIEYREEFVMDIYDTISQIGGALSVWSGVTVVCIFEILELLYWIIQYLCERIRSA